MPEPARPEAPTVFVVDDDPDVREFLSRLMAIREWRVQAFENAQGFLSAYDPSVSGCLVLDVNMPGMTGLELQRELIARGIKIPIVILTGGGDVSTARDAFRAGVVDFVLKPFHNAELLDCVAKALARDAAMRAGEETLRDARARFARLSQREREVIERIAEGKTAKQVALEMSLSSKTVDSHRANSLKKLGVNSMAELFRLAMVLKADKQAPDKS